MTPRSAALWLGRKTQKFSGTNQKPERPLPFGTVLVRHWARSIQPKFRPVRPGKEDHLKRWTSFSKLFRLDRTDPLSFGPKFPEILVEWIAPIVPRGSSPRSLLFFAPFFPARLVFPLPPLSAPGSPRMRVTPPWNVYMANCDHDWEGYPFWQTGLPTLAGHSTYHEPWFPVDIFFLSILMVRLFHIRYFENGPLEPGYPSCKRDEIKMRDYMGMWVIPPTWGPPPPCKQALNLLLFCLSRCRPRRRCLSSLLLWSELLLPW